MANLQSQIDILAKAVVKEHIGFETFKENNKGSVSLTEVSRDAKVYNSAGKAIEVNEGGGTRIIELQRREL